MKNVEKLLKEIMGALGSNARIACHSCEYIDDRSHCAWCYEGAMDEQRIALDAVHKFLGAKKVAKIYKELGYSWKGGKRGRK